jgi:hypothetical protein
MYIGFRVLPGSQQNIPKNYWPTCNYIATGIFFEKKQNSFNKHHSTW